MRYDRNFNPEWGYVAPAPSVMRTARLVGLAAIIGATVGAATVFSLLDRPTTEVSVAARTLVTPDPNWGGGPSAAKRACHDHDTAASDQRCRARRGSPSQGYVLCSDLQRYNSGRARSRAGSEAAKQETAHVVANRAAYGCSAL